MEFQDKVALITGGARGIGRAIAENLARKSAHIVLMDISESVHDTARELEAFGVKTLGITGSVTEETDVKRLFREIESVFGKLDICINNAGININNLTMKTSLKDFQQVLNVNLNGTFLVSRAAMLMMLKKRYGRIINISSIVGIRGNAGQAGYSSAKAGIIGLTKTMAVEVAKKNITVNTVAPGYIATEMTDALDTEVKARYKKYIPMQEFGTLDDVAESVAFLASDKAKYITGQTLVVDGGLLLI
ncbi:MAG: 3-oxoacyl-ACP reductase FabG [Spirochaetales bacterium]|nr:3-oxoacyl-ACP reductase FabG [Spirochaetales bacterium]